MTAKEPRYKREVFEGLLCALDVVLTDNGALHSPDDNVRGHYDIRDDGAWLRMNDAVAAFNWTPVCDLEEVPESPDPRTAPALPFPFTARQLAAFMLGSWGGFLGERFSDGSGQLDTEVVLRLLGGSLDTKLRESIAAAFSALQNARRDVPVHNPELWQELAKALAEGEAAETAALAAHDWTDANQPEEAQENRRVAYLAAVNPYRDNLRKAQAAYDKAQEAWRRAMVRQLLVSAQITNSVPVTAESAGDVQHKARRDLLDPVIEAAQKTCADPFDAPEVWAALTKMANDRKLPLLGVTDEGIKWQDAIDEPRFLKLKNLRERLQRRKKQRSKT